MKREKEKSASEEISEYQMEGIIYNNKYRIENFQFLSKNQMQQF